MRARPLASALALALTASVLGACDSSDPAVDASVRDAIVEIDAASLVDGGGAVVTDGGATDDAASADDAATVATSDGGQLHQQLISRTCGPADGFALNLVLIDGSAAACNAAPDTSYLSFYIHDLGGADLPPIAGATVVSTPVGSNGTASRCDASGDCVSTEVWSITFSSYADGAGAAGSYTIHWGDGSTSSGEFNAAWCDGTFVCG